MVNGRVSAVLPVARHVDTIGVGRLPNLAELILIAVFPQRISKRGGFEARAQSHARKSPLRPGSARTRACGPCRPTADFPMRADVDRLQGCGNQDNSKDEPSRTDHRRPQAGRGGSGPRHAEVGAGLAHKGRCLAWVQGDGACHQGPAHGGEGGVSGRHPACPRCSNFSEARQQLRRISHPDRGDR